jgi:hypothetical protein
MNIDSRNRELFDHKECDDPECKKDHSPFAPNFSCGSDSGSGDGESSTEEQDGCHKHEDFCRLPVIFDRRYDFGYRELCSRNFSLRLGGLRNRMAARLRQYLGCDIEIGYECESTVKKISGKITFVGTDFVEVLKKDENSNQEDFISVTHRKHNKDHYTMIPFDAINWLN